jgi:hypothetical protein
MCSRNRFQKKELMFTYLYMGESASLTVGISSELAATSQPPMLKLLAPDRPIVAKD